MSSLATFGAGVLGSLSADTILHPVDNLKCQYQTARAGSARINGRELLSLRALYRGYPAVVLAGAPGNGIFFLAYESAQRSLEDRCGLAGDAKYLLASALATVAATSAYSPMEVVKETAFAHRISSLEAVRRVHSERGVAGFFRGWAMGVATWVPYLSLYYVLYERLRKPCWWGASGRAAESAARPAGSPPARGDPAAGGAGAADATAVPAEGAFLADLSAGLAAAAIAATATYSLDTLKTRLQSGVVRADSWKALRALLFQGDLFSARGLALRVLWLAPGSALNVAFYERYASWLGGLGSAH